MERKGRKICALPRFEMMRHTYRFSLSIKAGDYTISMLCKLMQAYFMLLGHSTKPVT